MTNSLVYDNEDANYQTLASFQTVDPGENVDAVGTEH
jgi:hypothetical protein